MKRGVIKASLLGFSFLLILVIILFSLFSFSLISSKEVHYVGEEIKIPFDGVKDYSLKVISPFEKTTLSGSGDFVSYTPKQPGEYKFFIEFSGTSEKYSFTVIEKDTLEKENPKSNEISSGNLGLKPRNNFSAKTKERSLGELKKEVVIYSEDYSEEKIPTEDVLASSSVQEVVKLEEKDNLKVYWEENDTYIDFQAIDENNNGLIDKVEWVVSDLSENQTFIIVITKAQHLDVNKEFLSDIYEQVKAKDNSWSETINSGEYVRITFEKNLTSKNDITIYPRVILGNPIVEVYEKDSSEKIAEFNLVTSNEYNRVLLTNLKENQDTFDLKVIGGSLEFDYIIDPTPVVYDMNPSHRAYWGRPTATNRWLAGTNSTQAQYDNMNTENAVYAGNTMAGVTSNDYPFWRFNFTIAQPELSITSIYVKFRGYDNATEVGTVYVWRFANSTWMPIGVTPAANGNVLRNFTSDITSYIDSFHQFVIAVEGAAYDAGDSLIVDHVQLTVQYEIDSDPPDFTTIPANAFLFYENQSLGVDFDATDAIEFGYYSDNDTSFSINQTGFLSNSTPLAVGNYAINITVNDTFNNINWTIYTVQVNKSNDYDCAVYFNTTSPITHPANFMARTNCSSAYTLYRNGTAIANNSIINSGADYYNISVQRTDTQNYTNTFDADFFTIDKSSAYSCAVYFNATSPITYPDNFIVRTNCSTAYTLYRNGTSIANNSIINSGANYFNFTVQRTDIQNYTNSVETDFFTINKNSGVCGVYYNASSPLTYPNLFITYTNCTSTYTLRRNGTAIANNSIINSGVSAYNLSVQRTDNLNYTDTFDQDQFIINKGVPFATLASSAGWTITYPTSTTLSLVESNPGDTDLDYNIYRDLININTGETMTWGVNTHDYILNTTGGANYTINASMDTDTLTINPSTEQCRVLFNETSPLNYPRTFLAWANCTSPFTVYRNGTTIANYSEQSLDYGFYNFSLVRTDTINYTNNYNESYMLIDSLKGYSATTIYNLSTVTNLAFPPIFTAGWNGGEASAACYNAVAASDNTNCTLAYVSGTNPDPWMRFNFTIPETKSTINSITITAIGGSTGSAATENLSFNIANWSSAKWEFFALNTRARAVRTAVYTQNNLSNIINNHQIVLLFMGKDLDSGEVMTLDYVNIQVDSNPDLVPPEFTNIPQDSYLFYENESLNVDFDAIDNLELQAFNVNDTMFSIDSNGILTNATPMAVGNYVLNITINDTSNNINWTIYNLQVNKSLDYDCGVYFNSTSPLTYPNQFIVYTNCSTAYTLYRNGTSTANNSIINLGAGYFNFTVQRTDTANYTTTVDTKFFTINKGPNNCNVLFNATSPLFYPGVFLVYTNCDSGFTFLRNGTATGNNSLQRNGVGYFNFTVQRTDSINYTDTGDTQFFTVNKSLDSCGVYYNASSPLTYPNLFITYTNCTSAYTLRRNGTAIANNSIINSGASAYNLSVQRTDTVNYTYTFDQDQFIINKGTPAGTLASSAGWTIDYPLSTTISLSESNTGDTDLTYKIYRDNLDIGTGETRTWAFGSHNYILNTTGGTNYTINASMDTDTLTINKNITACSVYFSTASPITFPGSFIVYTDCTTAYTLYRNGTVIANASTITSGAGYFNFTVQRTDAINYTNTVDTKFFTVNKGPNNCNVVFNATSPLFYPNVFLVYSDCDSGFTIYRNATATGNNSLQRNGVGYFNFTVQRTDAINYTNTVNTQFFTINQSLDSCAVYFNSTSPLIYPNLFTAYTNCTSVYTLYRNGTSMSNNSIINSGVTAYNVSVQRTDTVNYTNTFFQSQFIINKGIPSATLASSAGWTIIYPLSTTISLVESNPGDTDLAYKIYRDNLDRGTGETLTWGFGSHNYLLNTTGGTNYTLNASMDAQVLTINKNTTSCFVYFNASSPLTYPNLFRAYTNCTTAYTLYRNGTSMANNSIINSGALAYNISVLRTDSVNYSVYYHEQQFIISKSPEKFKVLFNATSPLFYPDVFLVYTNSTSPFTLYRNGTATANNSLQRNGIGYFNFSAQRTDTFNYTFNYNETSFTINKSLENCQVLFNETSTLESPKTFLVWSNCTTPFTLRRNSTVIANNSEQVLSLGAYNFSMLRTDSLNYSIYYNETQMRIVDTTLPLIDYVAPTLANNSNVSKNWIYINISVIDANFKNITFDLYYSNYTPRNSTTFADSRRSINFTSLADGSYFYNVTAFDLADNSNETLTMKITLDTLAPVVNLITLNNSNFSSPLIPFLNYTVNDTNDIANCTLYGNWNSVWHANETIVNPQRQTNLTFSNKNVTNEGYYLWNVLCFDMAGNSAFNLTNYTFAAFLFPESPNASVINITQTRNDGLGEVFLSWNASNHSDYYKIYSTNNLSNTFNLIAQTKNTNYTDITANTTQRRFYKVSNWNPTGENFTDIIFGKTTYSLERKPNVNTKNWIGFYLTSNLTKANDSLNEISNATSFALWNETIQKRVICNKFSCPDSPSCTESNCNFNLENSRGYEVNLNTSSPVKTNWSTVGVVRASSSINLIKNATSFGKNWISVYSNSSLKNANNLITSISYADSVTGWNSQQQTSQGYLAMTPGLYLGTNFQIEPEKAYEVSVTQNTLYTQT